MCLQNHVTLYLRVDRYEYHIHTSVHSLFSWCLLVISNSFGFYGWRKNLWTLPITAGGSVNEAIKKSRILRSTIVLKSPNTPFWSKMVDNGRFHLYPIHRTPQEKKTHTPKKITYSVEKERTPFTPSSTVQVTARSVCFVSWISCNASSSIRSNLKNKESKRQTLLEMVEFATWRIRPMERWFWGNFVGVNFWKTPHNYPWVWYIYLYLVKFYGKWSCVEGVEVLYLP